MIPDPPDLSPAGVWGGAAGGFTSALRALQTPRSKKSLAVGVGGAFGAAAGVVLRWRYPEVPLEVVAAACGGVGFVSLELSRLFLKVAQSLIRRAKPVVYNHMDASIGPDPAGTPPHVHRPPADPADGK